jgi:hypothetical protein
MRVSTPKGLSNEFKTNAESEYDRNAQYTETSDVMLNNVTKALGDVGKATYLGKINMEDEKLYRTEVAKAEDLINQNIRGKNTIDNMNIQTANQADILDAQNKAQLNMAKGQFEYAEDNAAKYEGRSYAKGLRDIFHKGNNDYATKAYNETVDKYNDGRATMEAKFEA